MSKILILGNGYIGQKFKEHFGDEAVLSDLRVSDEESLRAELDAQKPEVVINCIGKTGRPNVDWCEDHQEETTFANVELPVMMAQVCQEMGIYMVHIGSGCMYSGDNGGRAYSEEDEPNFSGSFYSRSKIESEQKLRDFPVLQLRIRMPLDEYPGPRNFITKIAKYEKVISVPNSITVLKDFFEGAEILIRKRAIGVYNMVNPGAITHAEILDMYKELVDPDFTYEVFSMEELAQVTKAGRSNCVLSMAKPESEGVHFRPVHEAVRSTLEDYARML